MNKGILLTSMLLLSIKTIAQNWNPINRNCKYNYASGNDDYFATIWVDSVASSNNDSIYYLNKILKKVKQSGYADYYLNNQSQFFLSKEVKQWNGDILFEESSNKKYLLKTHAQLNEQWIFDSINDDTAKVINLAIKQIFGNNDSVKTILVSKTDTIILSESYGIIRFPLFDTLNRYVYLKGIEEKNLGLNIPKYMSFFSYNIGDVFCYEERVYDRWETTTTDKKIIIGTKQILNGSINYTARYYSRRIHKSNYNLFRTDTTYNDINNYALNINNDSTSFLNKYRNQLVNNSYKPVLIAFDSIFQTTIKTYPGSEFCKKPNSDTILNYRPPAYCSNSFAITENYTYGVNTGLINSNYVAYSFNPYPSGHYERLIGCIKNGIIHGNIFVDSLFLSVTERQIAKTDYYLYPNPIANQLTIETSDILKNGTLTVFNIQGQILITRRLKDEKTLIDVGELERGIYFIKLVNLKDVEVRKIIKQ